MKERGILFSAPMVRALLAGTKTQTRRVCKPAEKHALSAVVEVTDPQERGQVYNGSTFGDEEGGVQFACAYGGVGERLWVRESWASNEGIAGGIIYRADHGAACGLQQWDLKTGALTAQVSRWRPSIHMPRAASRILLEITKVRVERLQDISKVDALAESITSVCSQARDCQRFPMWRSQFDEVVCAVARPLVGPSPAQAYASLWNEINGAGAWDANPWVWAVSFQRVTP